MVRNARWQTWTATCAQSARQAGPLGARNDRHSDRAWAPRERRLWRINGAASGSGETMPESARASETVFGPAITLGVGLGGFVDGIVFHQILGWHHLLSERPGVDMRANEMADGLFHAGVWLVAVVGVLWLYGRLRLAPVAAAWPRTDGGPRPWRALIGPMLLGWGVFNIVEGLIDHQLLGLHHVRPGPGPTGWDIGYLIAGALLAGVGAALTRWQRRGGTAAGGVTRD
jgi:uncharacterized membrane protein